MNRITLALLLLAGTASPASVPEPSTRTRKATFYDSWTLIAVEWMGERTDQAWEHADPNERTRWGDPVWRDMRYRVTFEMQRMIVSEPWSIPGQAPDWVDRAAGYRIDWSGDSGELSTNGTKSLIAIHEDPVAVVLLGKTVADPNCQRSTRRERLSADLPAREVVIAGDHHRCLDAADCREIGCDHFRTEVSGVSCPLHDPGTVLGRQRTGRRGGIINLLPVSAALIRGGKDSSQVDADVRIGIPQRDGQDRQPMAQRPGIHLALRPAVPSR
jgi:hypothetical protein